MPNTDYDEAVMFICDRDFRRKLKLPRLTIKKALRRARSIVVNAQLCAHCRIARCFHVGGKCLFDSSYFTRRPDVPLYVGFPNMRRYYRPHHVPAFIQDLVPKSPRA